MKNLRTNLMTKIAYKTRWWLVLLNKLVSQNCYIKKYKKLLSDYGMNIVQDKSYIDPSTYFDNYDYSLISIGAGVTISREVLFLVHDFSLNKGLKLIGADHIGYMVEPISIGNNCFIGARVVLLPGTKICDNVIIGAGAVVKGTIPPNSVVVGNPAKIIGSVEDYGRKHFEAGDYIKIK